MSGSSSTNAVSPAGSSPNDLGSDSGSEVSQFSQAGNELIANLVHNVSPEGNSRSQSPDPTTASRQQRLIPTDDRDNEDALSSVSERTAVPSSSTDDVGRRVQARAREIEEELSRFCVDAGNRIPVTARHFIMAKVFEMVQLYSDLRADAAADRGAIRALKDQLVESRRETAALHRRAILAETRTGLLHPVAAVDHAAHAAPASTQPGAASALPGPFLPGAPGQPVPRTYAAALLSGAAPTASTVRPGLDGSVPALPPDPPRARGLRHAAGPDRDAGPGRPATNRRLSRRQLADDSSPSHCGGLNFNRFALNTVELYVDGKCFRC
ncbi:hypothetical protein MTO96_007625 [Rhipicephalus appendiculatus]